MHVLALSPRKRSVCAAAVLGLSLAFMSPPVSVHAQPSGSSTKGEEREPIKIGFVTTLTGPSGVGGKIMVDGIRLYLEQINHRMAGREVQLIVENDGGSPATAMEKLRKLVDEDKVQVADGFMLSNIAYAVAPRADMLRIPTVLCITGADDLTKRNRHPWVVRTGWCSSQCSQPFGEWAYKALHYRRIVTFGLDFPLGWELVGGFQKTFEDAGGKVVQKIWAPLGFVDFSSYIKSIRPDADAVLLATALTPAEIIPKQYKEFGPKLPVIAVGPSCDESSIKALGDEVLGTVSSMYYSAALNTPANKRFVEAYERMSHDRCCHYAETAYTSGMWIHQAVDALKGHVDDREKFLAALKKVQLTNAPRGPVKLDGYGNPIENYYVCRAERVHGVIQNSVIHTFSDVSQFWKYNPEEYLKQPPYDRGYPPCRYCQTNSP